MHELGFSRFTPARHHCPAYRAAALAARRQEVHHLPSCPAASPCQEVLLPSSPEALPQQATVCQQMPWSCRRELGLTSASHHPWRHTARWPAHPRGHCEQHPGVSNIEAARDNECAAAQTHFLPPSFPEALQCNTQSGCESECAAIGKTHFLPPSHPAAFHPCPAAGIHLWASRPYQGPHPEEVHPYQGPEEVHPYSPACSQQHCWNSV